MNQLERFLTFYNGPFALDFFRHGERKVVETVYFVFFPLSSLKKDQFSSLNKKESKLQFWGWKVLTRKLRRLLKVNTKSVCLQSRCAVKWVGSVG